MGRDLFWDKAVPGLSGSVMDPTLGGFIPEQVTSFPWMGREKRDPRRGENMETSQQLGQGDPSIPKTGIGSQHPPGMRERTHRNC